MQNANNFAISLPAKKKKAGILQTSDIKMTKKNFIHIIQHVYHEKAEDERQFF